mgnify:FL=1
MVLLLAPSAFAQAPILPVTPLENGRGNFLPVIDKLSSARLVEAVVRRESEFRTDVYGDHGLAYGPAQFHEETFYRIKQRAINKGEPFYFLDYRNPVDQLTLLNWALENGYGPEWSTYRKALADVRNAS